MADAMSPFLNKPVRTREQACADIARRGAEQANTERLRRLRDHGAAFGRTILDGAFERIYEPDGSYQLRPVGRSGSHEHPTPGDGDSVPVDAAPHAARPKPSTTDAIMRYSGYCAALRDISCWIAAIAMESRMDTGTLAALNTEIARLSQRSNAEDDLGEPHQMQGDPAAGEHGAGS
jgi:hypothetical protein